MAPKSKNKANKANAPQHQPKNLSRRVREVAQTADQAEATANDEQQLELIVPIQMAFTTLISRTWSARHCSAFCMVDSPGTTGPLWRDSFCVSVDSSWLQPPLHKYLRPEDADSPTEQLMVQLWQEHRFRERMQLAHKLLQEVGDVTGAAMALFDIAPAHVATDWVTRVQLACASYKFAWHSRPDPQELAPREMREGSLSLADVRWLRAQWLLARTLCAALFHSKRRSSGLLSMVSSAMMGFAPEDPMSTRFTVQRALGGCNAWRNVMEMTTPMQQRPTGLSDLPLNPFGLDTVSMTSAYNRALACYRELGPEAAESRSALSAALELDPGLWVPLLLTGGALRAPCSNPLVALGSKEEASAYCVEFGVMWWVEAMAADLVGAALNGDDALQQTPPVTWLAASAGLIDLCCTGMSLSHLGVVLCNIGMPQSASSCVLPTVIDEMNCRINGTMAVGTAKSSAPETCPSILRCHLVLLCTMAAVTQNLPPVQTCDFRLWHTPAAMLNIFTRHEVAAKDLISRLGDCASLVYDIAQRLVSQVRVWQQQEADGELQGELELLWPHEVVHWEHTLDELQPTRARIFWQTGQLRAAKDLAADLLQQQERLHSRLQSEINSSSSSSGGHDRDTVLAALLRGCPAEPGPVLLSLTALQEMQQFLNQQSIEVARRNLSRRTRGGSSSSSSRGQQQGAGDVQYPRYELCSAEALQRFTLAVLDAVGGGGPINAALEYGGLLNAYGHKGSGSGEGGEDEEDEDDSDEGEEGSTKKAEVGISVIEHLLRAPLPPAAAAAAGGGGGRGLDHEQMLRAADSRLPPGRRIRGREPSIVSVLRTSLSTTQSDLWLRAMGSGTGGSSSSSSVDTQLMQQHLSAIRQLLSSPDMVKSAVEGVLSSRRGDISEERLVAVVDLVMRKMFGEFTVEDESEGVTRGAASNSSSVMIPIITSGSSSGSAVDRLVRARLLGPDSGGVAGAGSPDADHRAAAAAAAAAGNAGAAAAGGGGGGAAASAGSSGSPSFVYTGSSSAGSAAFQADPGPGFVFGAQHNAPAAAAAAASAAFDAVLATYTDAAAAPPAAAAAGGPSAAQAAASEGAQQEQELNTPPPQGGAVIQLRPAVDSSSSSSNAAAAGSSAATGASASQGSRVVVPQPLPPGSKVCACCGGHFAKVYRCSGCAAAGLLTGYCSTACQKSHWSLHKKVCGGRTGAAAKA